jgi:hypothetical protein
MRAHRTFTANAAGVGRSASVVGRPAGLRAAVVIMIGNNNTRARPAIVSQRRYTKEKGGNQERETLRSPEQPDDGAAAEAPAAPPIPLTERVVGEIVRSQDGSTPR